MREDLRRRLNDGASRVRRAQQGPALVVREPGEECVRDAGHLLRRAPFGVIPAVRRLRSPGVAVA
eukprot:2662799-Alexandrium_andersonii.AAC.1